MDCAQLASATGWECAPAGENSLLIHSPATYADDGEHLRFYLMEESDGRFFLTDAHAAVDNLTSRGVRLSKNRLKAMLSIPNNHIASLTDDWEIVASGTVVQLQPALWEATAIAMALASKGQEWQPRTNQERFAIKVQKGLTQMLGDDKIVRKLKVVGASGHQLEFPFGIIREKYAQAVQPVGLGDGGRPDWGFVYQCFGKLSDLKERSSRDAKNRLVIMEASDSEDWKQAASLLATTATVIPYNGYADLALAA